jgi:hypothetical protein
VKGLAAAALMRAAETGGSVGPLVLPEVPDPEAGGLLGAVLDIVKIGMISVARSN